MATTAFDGHVQRILGFAQLMEHLYPLVPGPRGRCVSVHGYPTSQQVVGGQPVLPCLGRHRSPGQHIWLAGMARKRCRRERLRQRILSGLQQVRHALPDFRRGKVGKVGRSHRASSGLVFARGWPSRGLWCLV